MKGSSKTRYLKWIVTYCIALLTLVIIAVYVAAWFGVDTGNVLTASCGVFGGELLLTVLIKIMGGKAADATTKPAARPTTEKKPVKTTTDAASKEWG